MIEDRTHALRTPLELQQQPGDIQRLKPETRRRLERVFSKMRRQESLKPDLLDSLAAEVQGLM
jgi:hypothetical protein